MYYLRFALKNTSCLCFAILSFNSSFCWGLRGKESEVAQSCLTLLDSMDCSLPGSSVHEIFQARILSGLPFPSPGDLPNPGIEPRSTWIIGRHFTIWATRKIWWRGWKILKNFGTDWKSNRPYGNIKTLMICGKIKESYAVYIVANFKVSVLGEKSVDWRTTVLYGEIVLWEFGNRICLKIHTYKMFL